MNFILDTSKQKQRSSLDICNAPKDMHSWQARQVYNTCDFRMAKMLVGVPPNPLALLVTVTRSAFCLRPRRYASGPYVLTAQLPPRVFPAARRAAPINPYNLFAGP